jgi:hypothetical protein
VTVIVTAMLRDLPVTALRFQVAGGGTTATFLALRGKVVSADRVLESLGVWPGGLLEPTARLLERKRLAVQRVAPGGALAPWHGDTRAVRVSAPFDVYVGRRGNGQDHRPEAGWYGKPGGRGKPCGTCLRGGCKGRDEVLDCYDRWLRNRVTADRPFRDLVAALYGLRLACFCAPRRCHGDSLAAVADELAGLPADSVLEGILAKL